MSKVLKFKPPPSRDQVVRYNMINMLKAVTLGIKRGQVSALGVVLVSGDEAAIDAKYAYRPGHTPFALLTATDNLKQVLWRDIKEQQ